jgi:hypothetical protein
MSTITKVDPRNRVRHPAFLIAIRFASLLAALTLVTALPSFAWTYYSGASMGSDGTIYGWGVTDVSVAPMMYHTAYVTTTLTSPVKHRRAYGSGNAQNSVSVNVSLPFDPNDVGTYVVSSCSSGFCYVCRCWLINNQPSQASANDSPARLVPYNIYPQCAPNGVGPLQILNNQSVVDCTGFPHMSGFDGVNRNLMYRLVDYTGAPFPGAYNIAESFSSFQKNPSNSGLTVPQPTNANIAAGGFVSDSQYAGYSYPAVLGSNEHAFYTQSFTVTAGGLFYILSTQVSINLGNFNGTPEDNVSITTP